MLLGEGRWFYIKGNVKEEQPTRLVSAGMNRHGVTNERVVKKGIANHLESESCEGDRKATLEALTGAYAGRVSSFGMSRKKKEKG
jgi:hypothetical protein